MPRKSKTNPNDAAALSPASNNGKTKTRTRSTSTSKKKKASTGKTKSAKKIAAAEPTNEQIALRAYFIAERRQRLALTGDASSDWLEARRQLIAELNSR